MDMVKYCKNCGTQLMPEHKFCSVCGTPSGSVETGELTQAPPEPPVSAAREPVTPPTARKIPIWPFIAAGAFIIAAVLISVMFFLRPPEKGAESGAASLSSSSGESGELEESEDSEKTKEADDDKKTSSQTPAPAKIADAPSVEQPERISESVWRNALTDFLAKRTGLFEEMNVMLVKYYSDYSNDLLYLEEGGVVDFGFELCDVTGNGVPELLLVQGIPESDAIGWTLYSFDAGQYKKSDAWYMYPEFYRDTQGRTVVIAGPSALSDGFEAAYLDISGGLPKKEAIIDNDGYCAESGKTYDIYNWDSYGPDGAAWLAEFTADYSLAPIPRTVPDDILEEAREKSGVKPGWRDEFANFLAQQYGVDFFLYDFNGDGVPELLHSGDGFMWKAYEYKDGALSEIPAEDGSMYFGYITVEYDNRADNLRGMLCQDGGSGGVNYYLYYLDGGIIKNMSILEVPYYPGGEQPEYVWSAIDHYQDGRQIPGARPNLAESEFDNAGGVNIPIDDATNLENDLLSGEILHGYEIETQYDYYGLGNKLYGPGKYK